MDRSKVILRGKGIEGLWKGNKCGRMGYVRGEVAVLKGEGGCVDGTKGLC